MKPGRNDPCPCGSGNKYKRCCGSEAAARPRSEQLNPYEIGALVELVNQGRLADAEQRARSLLAMHATAGMLWKILSVTLLRQGKEALPELRRAAELMPRDGEAHGNLGSALIDQDQWAEGLLSLGRVLAIQPNDVQALVDSGNATRALGRAREAVPFYQRALQLSPQLAEAHNNLGNAFLELAQYDEAASCYARALKLKPHDALIHCNLGNALRRLGRLNEAISSCRQAIALSPALSDAHNQLGLALVSLGQYAEAAASYRQALTLNPRFAEALNNLGNVLRDLGMLHEAISAYSTAIEYEPAATSYCNLGNALLNVHRFDEAVANYRRALELQPGHVLAHVSLATGLRLLGRASEAEAYCRAALSIDSHDPEALFLLGELCADQGRFDEAQELLAQAIAINPEFPNALYAVATHRRMTAEDSGWLKAAERLLAKPLPLRHEISLRYALGKYHDDIRQYAEAFGNYQQANELTKRFGKKYDGVSFARRVDEVIASFDAGLGREDESQGNGSDLPVFVIGMPRSGTSLVEQILASHPKVFGAGELTFWDTAFAAYAAAGLKNHGGAGQIPGMAHAFLERLSEFSADSERVVDKMPANFMNVGLIRAAFPKARFIHVRRHPIDTCLSIYFQYFSHLHPYANDLGNLAHNYGEYARLMDHWRRSLPAATLFEIPYEGLIADQETWSRRMIEFLGLPWDPKCLEFDRTERVVITLSRWQVRQKIHSASAGRWRNYEHFLGPLQSLVKPKAYA
jgi:tetratricopeptide (TPR) repeat protein